MSRFASICIIVLLLCGYLFTHGSVWDERTHIRKLSRPGYVLPSSVSRILAVGNKGLVADFVFLKAITFIGTRLQLEENPSEDDWSYLVASLDVVTDLDPYFLDPYVFTAGVMVWNAGRIDDANRLLQKGIDHRTWEWRLPYYAGFNYFYFQKDYARGAEYIMAAAKIPGSPSFLKNLGARLAYYGKKTKTAVLFLKGMLAESSDPQMRKYLGKRLAALEAVSLIEGALEKYEIDFKRVPKGIEELVEAGYLSELPSDPYGGSWFLFKGSRVFSTSRFSENIESNKAESRQ